MLSLKELSQIYDKYADKIFRFVFVRVNSRETAQDLTSETFTRAFEYFKRNTEKGIDNVQAFLFKAASNLVTDYYRGKSRQNVSLDRSEVKFAVQNIASDNPHTELVVARNEDFQNLLTAIGRLRGEEADIVVWRYVEDMSVEKIAEITGRP